MFIAALAVKVSICSVPKFSADANASGQVWIGTWAAAPQPFMSGTLQTFRNQTLHLIAHTGPAARRRIKISNTYSDQPLVIGGAHIAHRTDGADNDPASDRALKFRPQLHRDHEHKRSC
jgi:hypothetical protein